MFTSGRLPALVYSTIYRIWSITRRGHHTHAHGSADGEVASPLGKSVYQATQ
jgi:hypothetical protein